MNLLKRKTNKGFTLLELLVAIAIVAILAAVAIPNYFQYTKQAKFSGVLLAADAMKIAIITKCSKEATSLSSCNLSSTQLGVVADAQIASASFAGDGTGKSGVLTITTGNDFGGAELKMKATESGDRILWSFDTTSSACTQGYLDCN